MVRPARLERATLCLEGRCSIQLSYGRNFDFMECAEPILTEQALWQSTQYPNLIRYVPSDTYYARFRGRGKLI